MLDNILNSVRRGAERAQRRGEEVAQVTRLRVEAFQLGRELDSAYARLGRAYHAGSDMEVLQGVRAEIRRIEEDISARERLITELGGDTRPQNGQTASGAPQPAQQSIVPGAAEATMTGNRPDFTSQPTTPFTGPGVSPSAVSNPSAGNPVAGNPVTGNSTTGSMTTGIPAASTEPTIPDAMPRPTHDGNDRQG
ncbi:hypothetical protein GCM10008955_17170 [Deinococcus malanensis]|uniref:Uncharacterized protein n=1 Tax=Deinococcus malanensis TaxID=1706855 RepID=A0ABQ2ETL7_9DEIO|nr:hypothetical protein [Deinococcus malanensis]GGK24158.1 hypothetical protein GCM10008955_17170 [Deinococcus malanensis]